MLRALRLIAASHRRAARAVLAGASAIEYGLLAAVIAVVTITALTSVGTKLGQIFGPVTPTLT
jgi:pilus assembly protein Flp/PilA